VKRRFSALAAAAALAAASYLVASPPSVEADHSWSGYHWARTQNPFALKVGDNVSSAWDVHLDTAIADWSTSVVLDLTEVAGGTTARQCKPTNGRVEVCNAAYGRNGWLGLAQIWLSGGHISQGLAKMNDTYFSMAQYNNKNEKLHVMCQEVGHTLGLGHQSESRTSLDTCMDYYYNTSDEDIKSTHPNTHDYDLLKIIYSHFDPTTTVDQTSGTAAGRSGTDDDEGPNNPADFGRPVGPKDNYGRDVVFVKDLPNGRKALTHVTWALPGTPGAPPRQH